MSLLKFIPIKLTICLVSGILIGYYFELGILVPLFTSLFFIIALAVIFFKSTRRTSISFGAVALFTAVCLGVLAISLWLPKNQKDHYVHQNLETEHLWKVKIREVLKSNSFSHRYIGTIFSMDGQSVSGKLILNIYQDASSEKFQVDNELLILGKLSEVKPPLNPHQFNYKSYLSNLGIYHQLRLDKTNHFTTKHYSTTSYGLAALARNNIISKLQKANFGKEELSIIQALLLGQRDDISKEIYTSYKNAGAVHILAVSGLHIGILLVLLQFILAPLEYLPKGKTIKLVLIVLLLWGFALLAGFSASVVRAVTMFSFVAYALYLNRPSNTFNILALSMFFILLVINPMLLFQVGFQMSYAAVFAIVWMYPLLQKLWLPKNVFVRKIWQLLSVSIAAQLGVLPISLFYFHQFPGLFFISNLIIVPALGIILGGGILVILLAVLNWLPNWLVTAYDTLIRLMNTIIAWVAEQEAFVFKNISFDAIQLVFSYVILFSLVLFLSKPDFKKAFVAALALLSFQSYIFFATYSTKQKEVLVIAHQTRNSVLLHQSGKKLFVYTQDSSNANRSVTDYQIAEQIASIEHKTLLNSYKWQNKTVLRIDSSGVVPAKAANIDYLLLTQSPKLNLERLLDTIRPKYIIADGSNYSSYVARWKQTCAKRKLPFHYTGEKGAYYFE